MTRISRRTITKWLIATIAVLVVGMVTSSALAARGGLTGVKAVGGKTTTAIDCPTECNIEYQECLLDGGGATYCGNQKALCLAGCH
jgi:hypothetical protein